MLVLTGRLLPLSGDSTVAPSESAAFAGRVWIGDDGTITAVTHGAANGPDGFGAAPEVDVGDDLVLPGLVDLHNHLAYDTLPLWTQPGRTEPFAHHDSWPGASTYAKDITWPAYALVTACPAELLAFAEVKAIVGGTTAIQGSPPKNRPRDGWLVRNIEDESFGAGANTVYASTLTLKPDELVRRAQNLRDGASFVYHCSEGQRGSLVAREFGAVRDAGALQAGLIAVHTNAVDPAAYQAWNQPGAIAWSPFSNLWLYGQTTDVPAARRAGIAVCLGSDWAPSGTKHVLGEAKVARLVADRAGWALSDEDIVRMMTCEPGDALARAWHRQVGRLQPGAQGDVVVIRATAGAEPFGAVLAATEADVRLVVVDGHARYGTRTLMSAARVSAATPITVGAERRSIALTRPDDPTAPWSWAAVLERMQEVRADPRGEIEQAQKALDGPHGARAEAGRQHTGRQHTGRQRAGHELADALRLGLDMPLGTGPTGGLPKDLDQIVVPPLQSLVHDAAWLHDLSGRGFHDGLLDGLARWYGR